VRRFTVRFDPQATWEGKSVRSLGHRTNLEARRLAAKAERGK
jgi:hypothetical protein